MNEHIKRGRPLQAHNWRIDLDNLKRCRSRLVAVKAIQPGVARIHAALEQLTDVITTIDALVVDKRETAIISQRTLPATDTLGFAVNIPGGTCGTIVESDRTHDRYRVRWDLTESPYAATGWYRSEQIEP